MKDRKVLLILIIVLVIITIFIAVIATSISKKNKDNKNISSNEVYVKPEEEKKKEEIEKLKEMNEKSRIKFYLTKYISYIETNEYEYAYNLLYSEFKDNYFKDIEDFKRYVKNKYPNMMSINVYDVQREGQYYILTVMFADIINDEKTFTQKFIIREDNYDEFVLSFQAE